MRKGATKRGGGSDVESLKFYLKEISHLTPLTREEEKRLASAGREEDLAELARRNLKYVVMIANRYKGMGLSLADLVNEGNIGLVEASRRFDHERGVKFITYAIWWVKQSILRALAEQSGVVRLPVKRAGLLSRMSKTIERLTRQLQREPTLDEVAEEMGVKYKTLMTLMRVYKEYLSLDSPISDEDETIKFIDILAPDQDATLEKEYFDFRMRGDIKGLLDDLSARERAVLKLRYGFDDRPLTLEEIGARLGLTRERIRQIEKGAKEKLRSKSNLKLLKDYLY